MKMSITLELMANKRKYDIRCVELDGSDYSCETFASREAAEQQLNCNPRYQDNPLYEYYYVCPAGVSDIPCQLEDVEIEPANLTGSQLDAYFDAHRPFFDDY